MRFFPLIRFISTIVVAVLVLAAAAAAQGESWPIDGTIVHTGGAGVSCRAYASADAEVVGVLPEGTSVELAGEPDGDWQPVACDGTPGFVRLEYVEIPPKRSNPALAGTAGATPPSSEPSRSAEPLGTGMVLGVTTDGIPEDPAKLDAFADKIGRMPAAVAWYQGWGDYPAWAAFQPQLLQNMTRRGATPVITWDPWDPRRDPADQPEFRLANILRGDFDDHIDSWAEGLAAFGQPVYLRFATEMNGNWLPWSVGLNGNTAEQYVETWRYVYDRFAAARADNVRWVWSPNANWYEDPVGLRDIYPGDEYVDWVALDGFNWGTSYYWEDCSCQSFWQTFEEVFGSSYDVVASITDKPMMIAETASSEEGGDKAVWIRETVAEMPDRFPQVRALIWFDIDKETDWRVDSSAASLRAFAEVAQSPEFTGTLR